MCSNRAKEKERRQIMKQSTSVHIDRWAYYFTLPNHYNDLMMKSIINRHVICNLQVVSVFAMSSHHFVITRFEWTPQDMEHFLGLCAVHLPTTSESHYLNKKRTARIIKETYITYYAT